MAAKAIIAAEGPVDSEAQGVVKAIVDSHVGDLLWEGLKGAFLGGFLGVVLALVAFFAIRAAGGYRWEWKHAVWFRVLTFVFTIIAVPGLAGWLGVLEGALRGGTIVIQKSQLATDVFPVVGGACADTLLALEVMTARGSASDVPWKEIEDFRASKRELDVKGLLSRVDAISKDVVDRAVTEVEKETLNKTRWGEGAAGRGLLHMALVRLGDWVMKKLVQDKARDHGIDLEVNAFRDDLVADAKRAGDPDKVGRDDVSQLVVRRVIVPSILKPLRSIIRGQQLVAGLLLAGALVVPVILFRIAEVVRRSGVKKEAAPS